MNKIFRLVWSRVKGCYVVASELAKSNGKAKRGALVCALAAITSLSAANIAEAAKETLVSTPDGGVRIVGDKDTANAGVEIIGKKNTVGTEEGSTVWGNENTSTGDYSTAWGNRATAEGDYSTAWGRATTASGNYSTAWGDYTVAGGNFATAFGMGSKAYGSNSLAALGGTTGVSGTTVKGMDSVAIGDGALAQERKTYAIGELAQATAGHTIAFGNSAQATATYAIALGREAKATATNSLAFGNGATASYDQSLAIGNGAAANHTNSVAIGANSVTTADNTVSVGNATTKRKIVNVADGSIAEGSTDAVNGDQLYDEVKKLEGMIITGTNIPAVTYDNTVADNKQVTLIGTGGTRMKNLADGELSETSQDAVNGRQLYATNQKVEANTTAIAENKANIATNTANIATNTQNITRNTADIAENRANISGLNSRVNKLDDRIDKVGASAAALAALRPMDMDDGGKFAMAIGTGVYKSKAAGAVGVFYRPSDNVMLSLGGSMSGRETLANFGISFALDKNVKRMPSRKVLANKVEELEGIVAQQAAENAELKARLEKLEAILLAK